MNMVHISDILASDAAGYWGDPPDHGDVNALAVTNGSMTGTSIASNKLPLRSFTRKQYMKARIHPHDILLSTSGDCGKLALVTGDMAKKPICATNFVRILRFVDEVDARYVYHLMRTRAFQSQLAPFIRGTSLKNLSWSRASKVAHIPLPPLEEQRRIAAILDQADAIRVKRRQVLANLNSLPEQLYRQEFATAPTRATVAEIASDHKGSIRTGPFGSQLLHSEFVDSGVAVLGLDNVVSNTFTWGDRRYITTEKYDKLKRYTVSPDDVLISIMGTTGRCVVVPDDIPTAINTKHICAITVNKMRILPQFLRASFLWHPSSRAYLRRQTKGSIMDGLNMGIIKGMPIPVPDLNEQKAYVDSFERVSLQTEQLQEALAKDNELFASLQSRAFKGEL